MRQKHIEIKRLGGRVEEALAKRREKLERETERGEADFLPLPDILPSLIKH